MSAIDGVEGIAALAADTAGEMRAKGLDPLASLSANDAWSAFDAIGKLFVPGPTGADVSDFRSLLVRAGMVPGLTGG